jgi:S-formylglutathione hydrolase FrmB
MRQFLLGLLVLVVTSNAGSQTGQLVYSSFISPSLNGMSVPVTTYLPPNYSATGTPYRLYIFLHGAGQNQNFPWSVLQPVLDQMINANTIHPMVVVCPGLNGPVPGHQPLYYSQHLYRNSARNGNFEDAVMVDLMNWLDSSSGYNISSVREQRAIGGFSDGGTGASYLGVRHNDKFVAFVSHHGSMALREYLDTTSTWFQSLLSESGGSPPYSFSSSNGIYSLIYFGNSSAFSPNLANPPTFLDLPVDGQGHLVTSVANTWLTENDPTTLILSPIYTHSIGMFFQSRPSDWISYAFNTRFDDELNAANIPHAFLILSPGGHTFTADAASIALEWLESIMNSPPTNVVNVSLTAGWNMISNPLTNPIPDDSSRHLFPTIVSQVFRFTGGYVPGATMLNGIGYWGKFPGAVVQSVEGAARTRDSVSVVSGWNMVGSISSPVDTASITSIPPGLKTSNWFEFSGGYAPASQITPGKAYWIKANGAGMFVFTVGPGARFKNRESSTLDGMNALTISDTRGGSQTLYFGANPAKELVPAMYDMPPLPPKGAFDARFETMAGGSMVQPHGGNENFKRTVAIQSESYPLTLTWEVRKGAYELVAAGKSVLVSGNGTMKLTGSEAKSLTLKLIGESSIPKAFALNQNYPNPFNPSTTIKYDLPIDTRVTLKLYNILGQEVATLVSEDQKAGYRSVDWNASNFASGVYFYRLEAGSFVSVKKLLLLK